MDMKIPFAALLAMSSLAAASESGTTPCEWPASLDAVVAAPGNHKVLLDNEHVRVLEVTVAPHSTEPVHAHCWPSTLYIQEMTDMIDRDADGKVVFDTRKLPVKPKPPFARWTGPQPPHAIENLGDTPLKLLRVEQKD